MLRKDGWSIWQGPRLVAIRWTWLEAMLLLLRLPLGRYAIRRRWIHASGEVDHG
jgi:hypothetical protein